jgi:hypothetical protein
MKQIIITINEDGSYHEQAENLNLIEIAGLLKIATKLNDYQILKLAKKIEN